MNNIKTSCEQAKKYWKIGIQYLHLVETVSSETIKQGNAFAVFSDEEISVEEFAERTKWSDHSLIIPLLFNYYHGIELILKGFLVTKDHAVKKNHKLSELLEYVKNIYNFKQPIANIEKYIKHDKLPPMLAEFCLQSDITMDDYYQSLKYPESNKSQCYQHYPLRNKGEDGVQFFSDLKDDIGVIRRETVSRAKEICPDHKA